MQSVFYGNINLKCSQIRHQWNKFIRMDLRTYTLKAYYLQVQT